MTTEAARRDTKGELTRARVLEAAAAVFRERGYAGVRLSDVAERVDMQAGSLYYHFASREELVAEVLAIGHERMLATMRELMASLPADITDAERLREAMIGHVVAVLGTSDYTSAALRIVGQVPAEIRRPVLNGQATYAAFWRRLLASAQASGAIRSDADLPAVRMLLMGGLNSTTEWYRPRRARTQRRFAEGLAALCVDGIAVHRPRTRMSPTPDSVADPSAVAEAPISRRDATRSKILHAAASTFAQQGYGAARLVDIAEAAGMQAGSLYYHFDSREDLVTELLRVATEQTHRAVSSHIDDLPASATHADRLTAAMVGHLRSVWTPGSDAPALVRIFTQVPPEVRARVAKVRRAYSELWLGLVESALEAGELTTDLAPLEVVLVINGAMNWTVEWYRAGGRLSPDDVAAELASLVFDGLGAVPAPRD